jgi:integrase
MIESARYSALMSRSRTGSLQRTKDGRWQAVVTLADGSRKRLPPFAKGTSEAMLAQKHAEQYSEVRIGSEPDNIQWFESWIARREQQGIASTRENRQHYRYHITPVLGARHIKYWTVDDLRKLSSTLDGRVVVAALSWKTARNVWDTVSKMLSDAVASKHAELRVRDDNPASGVRGPERGVRKGKQFIYPGEFLRLLNCEEVPEQWKTYVALATYLYVREGELRALRWEDVDLDHAVLHVHQAADRITGKSKSTKSGVARRVPIEPRVLPLLRSLSERRRGSLVVPDLPTNRSLSNALRRYLKCSGATRSELHTDSATRAHFGDLFSPIPPPPGI